jgi:hypothetical protein
LVDTRVKVQPTRVVNTYPTLSISLFDWDTSQSSISLRYFYPVFFKKPFVLVKKMFLKEKNGNTIARKNSH